MFRTICIICTIYKLNVQSGDLNKYDGEVNVNLDDYETTFKEVSLTSVAII